jgi:hypothetical protein
MRPASFPCPAPILPHVRSNYQPDIHWLFATKLRVVTLDNSEVRCACIAKGVEGCLRLFLQELLDAGVEVEIDSCDPASHIPEVLVGRQLRERQDDPADGERDCAGEDERGALAGE